MHKDMVYAGLCLIAGLAILLFHPPLAVIETRLFMIGLAFGIKAAFESEKEF